MCLNVDSLISHLIIPINVFVYNKQLMQRHITVSYCCLQKYYGRKSSVGRDVCRLRKAYYSARNEAAVQIDEIVGETASEADSSDSLERDHSHHHHAGGGAGSHDKDDDVIRCICGMYKDEGLMIQCDKCMVGSSCIILSAASGLVIDCSRFRCLSRFGSTLTACAWRRRWSTTCVSSVTPGLWTGFVWSLHEPIQPHAVS